MEQFANLYSTTLASSYTAGGGSISVTSAAGAPTAGTFSLTILDVSTGAVILIFRVTSVSGTTFTGAAEGTGANAASGSTVVGTMVTAASLRQLRQDQIQSGALSSIPAAGNAGAAFLPTDGSYLYRDNGTAWIPFGPVYPCKPPLLADYTAVNPDPATTYDNVGGPLNMTGISGGGAIQTLLTKTAPTAPWVFRCGLTQFSHTANYKKQGICCRESATGKFITLHCDFQTVFVDHWNGINSDAGSPINAAMYLGGPTWFSIEDDGTNVNFKIGPSPYHLITIYSESRTAFLAGGPDQIGFMTYSAFSAQACITVFDCSL